MDIFELKGTVRKNLGKKASREERKEERVPCVLYGDGENVHFSVLEKEVNKLLYTPNVYIVKLDLDGKTEDAILKDSQFHPVTDRVLHLDFYRIFEDKKVEMQIPVSLKGFAEGVRAGGKLNLLTRKLRVYALPADLPKKLEVDVTNLGLGKAIKVKDLQFENVEILNPQNMLVAQVKLTRAARAAAQTTAAE